MSERHGLDRALQLSRPLPCLDVAQPSLSAQIAQLEAGLGVRLFERDRRRVVPTDVGQEILEGPRRPARRRRS